MNMKEPGLEKPQNPAGKAVSSAGYAKKLKKGKRKQQLLECALKLFAEKGYHATTVADIVRKAGVARGTFYLYFKDKRDLFQELLKSNFAYIFRVLPDLDLAKEMSEEELKSALRLSLEKLLSHKNSIDFITILVEEASGVDKAFADQVEHFYKTMTNIFCGYVARAQTLGKAKKTDPYLIARFIVGILKETIYQWARGEIKDLDELARTLVDFVMYGIRGDES